MENKRNPYFDICRGSAIFFVIGIHTYSYDSSLINLFVRQFLNCAVPLFLAISGYFIGRKHFDNKRVFFSFFKKQTKKVYIPMLLWSVPWLLISIMKNTFDRWSIFYLFIGGFSIYYFIPLIMQCYLLTPLAKGLSKKVVAVYGLVTLIGMVGFLYCQHILCLNLPMVFSGGPCVLWIAFYVLGVYFSENPWICRSFVFCVACALLFIAFSLHEIQLLSHYGHTVWGIKLTSHFYSFFIILIIFSEKLKSFICRYERCLLFTILAWFGRISFFVYLTHCLLIWLVGKYISSQIWYLKWCEITIMSMIFGWFMNAFIPIKIKKYIGL